MEKKWSSCFYSTFKVSNPNFGVTKIIFCKNFNFTRKCQVLSFHWYFISENWTRNSWDKKYFDMSGLRGAPNFKPPSKLSGGPKKIFFRCFGIYWYKSSNPPKIFKIRVGHGICWYQLTRNAPNHERVIWNKSEQNVWKIAKFSK